MLKMKARLRTNLPKKTLKRRNNSMKLLMNLKISLTNHKLWHRKKELNLRNNKENSKKKLKIYKKKKCVLKKCSWPKHNKKKLKLNY